MTIISNKLQILASVLLLLSSCDNQSQVLTQMRVENEVTPLGIDTPNPRFSWQLQCPDNLRGYKQVAYHITVIDPLGRCVWDSGETLSSESHNIEYNGAKLQAATHYDWTVEIKDQNEKVWKLSSWFETGLQSKSDLDPIWMGAKWIGVADDDQSLYAPYLTVFRLNADIQLDQESRTTNASIIYGANDQRLNDARGNVWHLQAKPDSSYIRVELDVSGIENHRPAMLNVYRAGYSPQDDAARPFCRFDISSELLSSSNIYQPHHLSIASCLGETEFCLDSVRIGTYNLNPYGKGGDYIALPALDEVGIAVNAGQRATFSNVTIQNYRSPMGQIAKLDELNITADGGSTGYQTIFDPSRNALPLMYTKMRIDKEVAKARLYVTARGIYDIYVNGQRIGSDYFNPGATQYNKTHLYQIFDITDHLTQGANTVGAQLAEGWWMGGATYEGKNWNYFGDRLSLLACLKVTFADGTTQHFVTSPNTWSYTVNGPVRCGSFFQGEVYDARLADDFWTSSKDVDQKLKPATVISTNNHVSSEGWGNGDAPDNYGNWELIPQFGQTVRAIAELQSVGVTELQPGTYIYDMGQNFTGVPSIALSGLNPGTEVKFRYAEVLYPDLPEYSQNKGQLMLENIRAAYSQDIYYAKGGEEVFSPRYTNHGYRYIEVTGIEHPLPLSSVRGIVLSSIDQLTADFRCSDDRINKLWKNITWSTLSNFVSIPTDCPQRNERLGWAGDISVFSHTATYLAFLPQFLNRYLRSMRDVQSADGRMPDIAPLGGGFGGLLWGSASITVAWVCWQQYADRKLLVQHYDAMARYIDFIFDQYIDPTSGVIVQTRSWGDLGDWLGLEDLKNDKSLFWESYLIYDLHLMSLIATELNKPQDAYRFARLCQERKDFFAQTYLRPYDFKTISSGALNHPKGQLIDTQTSYVLPLALGVVSGDVAKRVARNLKQAIERENTMDDGRISPAYSLLTGFIGTAWISQALSDAGMCEIAYRLLLQDQYPSWLYPVSQGATTVWERLNSYTHLDGFGGNNGMNSFNHYAFGAVGAWLLSHSLGIQRDYSCPGFQHFFFAPEVDPTGHLSFAEGYYDSPHGRIESRWEIRDAETCYQVTVPCNTTATFVLPGAKAADVSEGNKPIMSGIEGITEVKEKNDTLSFVLSSGHYNISVTHILQ